MEQQCFRIKREVIQCWFLLLSNETRCCSTLSSIQRVDCDGEGKKFVHGGPSQGQGLQGYREYGKDRRQAYVETAE